MRVIHAQWAGSVTVDVDGPAVIHAVLDDDTTLSLPSQRPGVGAFEALLLLRQPPSGEHTLTLSGMDVAAGVILKPEGNDTSLIRLLWTGTGWRAVGYPVKPYEVNEAEGDNPELIAALVAHGLITYIPAEEG